jgi:hypothetical protein
VKLRCLQVIENMERETGIGPATNSLEGCDSTIELLPLFFVFNVLHCVLMDTFCVNVAQGRNFAQSLHKHSPALHKCTNIVVHLAIASFGDILPTCTNLRSAQLEEVLSPK